MRLANRILNKTHRMPVFLPLDHAAGGDAVELELRRRDGRS